MPFKKVDYIWMNGKMVNWDDAKIHVLSHVVHYGSSLFEGQRCYKTPRGPACFRHQDHVDRLWDSCKIYRMEIPFTKQQIFDAILELIAINKLEECYVRPVVYRGYDSLGVDPTHCPVDVAIAVWPWGKYLGPEALVKGVKVCVSSWNRNAPNTTPMMAKSSANYMNGQLIKMEALARGCVEGIALDIFGHVSEGSGENVFIVKNGVLITPPFSSSVLPGITRRTVIKLADDLGIKVIEEVIPREALYIADEVFFTGSAAEVTPISEIDGIMIGTGQRGPITEKIQTALFDILEGRVADRHGWLTFVNEHVRQKVAK
ncbi:MAG: branched-chain amino acid transaminase [candidate division Zixibacteria bacterium]|nr:branched-chain amino acid transaminase [candidate division Zixibacteria bacterium]MDD5426969.1 branched-chain amino acid transaminase [candidate division Zixibacteria bacterium]